MSNDSPVERITGQCDAGRADDVLGCALPAALRRPDSQDGEVARAASEVPDQNELVPIERLLVTVGRCNWLELEHDFSEPACRNRISQPPERELVIRRVVGIREMHRTSDHDARRRPSTIVHGRSSVVCLCIIQQVPEDERDHVFEGVPLREHAGAVEPPVGEICLQRLNQPSLLFRFKVALQRSGSGSGCQPGDSAFFAPFKIEN